MKLTSGCADWLHETNFTNGALENEHNFCFLREIRRNPTVIKGLEFERCLELFQNLCCLVIVR